MRSQADADAVARCLAGEREAFADLVLRYQDRVFGLALRLCGGHRADAQDAAQEAFLRAYAALGRYDAGRPWLPWLLRIAVNVCRDRARRRSARPEFALEAWESVADPADGPEGALLRAERRRAVRAAVAALPENQRVLIALAYDQELALGEIAQALRLPLTVVKNRLYRARRAIAARLRREEEEHGLRDGARPLARPGRG